MLVVELTEADVNALRHPDLVPLLEQLEPGVAAYLDAIAGDSAALEELATEFCRLFLMSRATSPMLSMLAPQPQEEWDSLPIENLQATHINLDTRSQGWWLMGTGDAAEVAVAPGPIRIESRLLDRPGDEVQYVLETVLDDRPAEYHKLTTRPSGKATHETWLVSHKERVTLQVPHGVHGLRVRVLAPSRTDCLIRIRQSEPVAGD